MTQNPNQYYVYIYLDQRKPGEWNFKEHVFKFQPFYIGKGKKYRDTVHLTPFGLSQKNFRSSKIKAIIAETGEEPLHHRVYENLLEEEALKIEIEMIKHFGRIDVKTGILTNLTDGGESPKNLSPEKIKQRLNKVSNKIYQYSAQGDFIREWESEREVIRTVGNIFIQQLTRRKGTAFGCIWLLEYKGPKIEPRIPCFQPPQNKYLEIKQVDLKTGKVIKIFKNIKEVTESSFCRSSVHKCLRGEAASADGYYWTVSKEKKIIVPLNKRDQNRLAHKITKKSQSGKIIKEYRTVKEAHLDTGLSQHKIRAFYKKKEKDPQGFIWETNGYPPNLKENP